MNVTQVRKYAIAAGRGGIQAGVRLNGKIVQFSLTRVHVLKALKGLKNTDEIEAKFNAETATLTLQGAPPIRTPSVK